LLIKLRTGKRTARQKNVSSPSEPGRLLLTSLLSRGHAGAIISGGKGKAEDKVAALQKAGAAVVDSPAKLGSQMLKSMQEAGLA